MLYFLLGKWPNQRAKEMPKQVYDIVKTNGIAHYTTKDNADKIMNSGVIYGNSGHESYSAHGMKSSFFFVNSLASKIDIDINVSAPHTHVILINHLTDSQLNKCRYRSFDNAIVYDGNFEIETNNIVICKDAERTKRVVLSKKDFIFTVQFYLPFVLLFIIILILIPF